MFRLSSKSLGILFGLVSSILGAGSDAAAQEYAITISAGGFDRIGTPVSFNLPEAVEPGVYRMTAKGGNSVFLQVDDRNRGWFLLGNLPAGSSREYRMASEAISPAPSDSAVTREVQPTTISFRTGGQEILSYFHGLNEVPADVDERYHRGGYIHPVYSPGGVVLTDHLHPSHPHHSGIWSAWTNTIFQGRTPDFWNVHLNTGRVDQAGGLQAEWEGPVHAGFRAKHHFIDLSGGDPLVALNEQWEVTIYRTPGQAAYRMFDLVVTQTVNTGEPLLLPEYRYGGVGFRGHADWDGVENTTFLTSEGLGRDGHGTRTRWTHVGGRTNGRLAGIAILGHPENFRHPQTVRIHPEEPFFNFAPSQLGEMSIQPGTPYVARYRYVTYDGEPDPSQIDRLWSDYAYPPGVTVSVRR